MSDYIERKSIRNLYSCLDPEDKVRVAQVLIDIDAIPSDDAVSEWIPCSERMPSEDGWYLIALAFEWGIEYEAGRWEDGIWWNPNSHVNVAWMPLPQPYKETDQ